MPNTHVSLTLTRPFFYYFKEFVNELLTEVEFPGFDSEEDSIPDVFAEDSITDRKHMQFIRTDDAVAIHFSIEFMAAMMTAMKPFLKHYLNLMSCIPTMGQAIEEAVEMLDDLED